VLTAPPVPPELLIALAAAFRAHLGDVLAFARCLGAIGPEVEDIAQEAFVAMLEAMACGRYDTSQPAIAWLRSTERRIGRRRALPRKRLTFLQGTEPFDPADLEDIGREENRHMVRQQWSIVLELLDALTPELRSVYLMHELEQMTAPEIADALEVPVGTVNNRLRLARRDVTAALARMRARERRSAGELGAVLLPLDAAALLRTLPAPAVSEEHRARLWQRVQRAIRAEPVPVQSVTPAPRRRSHDVAAPAFPSLLRTASGRVAFGIILFVLGMAVGLLVALLAPLRSAPTVDRSAVVYSSAPLETAARTPGAALPAVNVKTSAPAPAPLPASPPHHTALRDPQSEARFITQAREALARNPPDAAAALEALATRARLFGPNTPLHDEAVLIQRQAEALRGASMAATP